MCYILSTYIPNDHGCYWKELYRKVLLIIEGAVQSIQWLFTIQEHYLIITFYFVLASCNYNGVTFLDGETIKDDCNTCQCSSGEVTCSTNVCKKPAHCKGVFCPMCVGITKPGDCCPTCSTLPVA